MLAEHLYSIFVSSIYVVCVLVCMDGLKAMINAFRAENAYNVYYHVNGNPNLNGDHMFIRVEVTRDLLCVIGGNEGNYTLYLQNLKRHGTFETLSSLKITITNHFRAYISKQSPEIQTLFAARHEFPGLRWIDDNSIGINLYLFSDILPCVENFQEMDDGCKQAIRKYYNTENNLRKKLFEIFQDPPINFCWEESLQERYIAYHLYHGNSVKFLKIDEYYAGGDLRVANGNYDFVGNYSLDAVTVLIRGLLEQFVEQADLRLTPRVLNWQMMDRLLDVLSKRLELK